MKRIVLLYMVLLVIALPLAGCGSININTIINPDGSGMRKVSVAIERRLYELMTAAGSDPLVSIRAMAEASGARIEPLERTDMAGLAIAQPFQSLEELSQQWSLSGAESLQARRSDRVFKIVYIYEARIDASQFRLLAPEGVDTSLGSLNLNYTVTMPGTPVDHNASEVRGQTLIWHLDPATSATYDLFAVSEVVQTTRIVLAVVAGVISLLLLLVIAWAVFKRMARI